MGTESQELDITMCDLLDDYTSGGELFFISTLISVAEYYTFVTHLQVM